MPSDALTDVLRAEHIHMNEQFMMLQRRVPRLDSQAVLAHVAGPIDLLAQAVARHDSARTREVVCAAYAVSLEMFAEDLLGPRARNHWQADAWHSLIPALAPWVATDPQRTLRSMGNALHNLSNAPGARPVEWLNAMTELARWAPAQTPTDTMLAAGQVLAWRSGLAHYRLGALAAAALLPEAITRRVLRAPELQPISNVLKKLAADPLHDVQLPSDHVPRLRLLHRIGGFRGFGGPFAAPPNAHCLQLVNDALPADTLLVTDGREQWLLCADVYGATLQRSGMRSTGQPNARWKMGAEGAIVHADGQSLTEPAFADASSRAGNNHIIAITSPRSHFVLIYGVA